MMVKVDLPIGVSREQALTIRNKVSWSGYPNLYTECVLTSDGQGRERYYISCQGSSWMNAKTLKKWIGDYMMQMGIPGSPRIRNG